MTAFNGQGPALSPGTADLLAGLILGSAHDQERTPAEALRLDRFDVPGAGPSASDGRARGPGQEAPESWLV
ncbi:MAG: hypothetical protein WD535_01680 [Thermaerobacterales bacterium]